MVADLTKRRSKLLRCVLEQCIDEDKIPNDLAVHRVVDFAFSDKNCKIKFKSRDNKFFTINSEKEFLNLVNKLDQELSLSDAFKKDECSRENYGMFEEEGTLNDIYY